MSDDKKKQAMSLLFGDAPAKPTPNASAAAKEELEESPSRQVAKTVNRRKKPAKRTRKTTTPATNPGVGGAGETPDPYYQGASRYRRASGEQVKHSVYLDPDVSQAIKVAAAMGDDPRGTNVSAIVNQALQDAGYGTPNS